jgi:hypothetical protein
MAGVLSFSHTLSLLFSAQKNSLLLLLFLKLKNTMARKISPKSEKSDTKPTRKIRPKKFSKTQTHQQIKHQNLKPNKKKNQIFSSLFLLIFSSSSDLLFSFSFSSSHMREEGAGGTPVPVSRVNREIERGERVWGRFGNLIRWRAVVVEKEKKRRRDIVGGI